MYKLSALLWLIGIAIGAGAEGQPQTDDARSGRAPPSCHLSLHPDTEGDRSRDPENSPADCSDAAPLTAATSAPEKGRGELSANPSSTAPQPATLTLICYFSSGPHAGVVADLTGVRGAVPVPVGSICSDGAASSGTAVVRNTNLAAKFWSDASRANGVGAGRAGSTICQFMSGPKAHGWHDYAPLPPAPVGSSCQDGMTSAGVVMASGHGEHY